MVRIPAIPTHRTDAIFWQKKIPSREIAARRRSFVDPPLLSNHQPLPDLDSQFTPIGSLYETDHCLFHDHCEYTEVFGRHQTFERLPDGKKMF